MMEAEIKKYNNLENKNIKFNDYIIDKFDIIHNQIYESALNKYLSEICGDTDLDEYKKQFTFIELKNNDYFLPSTVVIKKIIPPYSFKKVDLTPYWNFYEFTENTKTFNEDFYEDDMAMNNICIISIDKVKGRIKLRNKYTGKEFWKDIKYLQNDIPIDKDSLTLYNTFSYKLQNKIYGR